MPGCLHPKLLNICQQCYGPDGFDPSPIGWTTGDPEGDGSEVDHALVGRVGEAIVVAYRGTLAPGGKDVEAIVDDWVNNVQTNMVEWGGARVHRGFLDSHRALWPHVQAAMSARLTAHMPRAIVVTGHSKGGAIAPLAAVEIRAKQARGEWPAVPVQVVTFAGPRVGDRAFADHYAALRIPTLRYENRADIVPRLPLGENPQPIVRRIISALGAKFPVAGYVAVGDAHVDGPGPLDVAGQWLSLAWRLFNARNPKDCAIPLVAAHGLDGEYRIMANSAAQTCAQHRHAECAAALG